MLENIKYNYNASQEEVFISAEMANVFLLLKVEILEFPIQKMLIKIIGKEMLAPGEASFLEDKSSKLQWLEP